MNHVINPHEGVIKVYTDVSRIAGYLWNKKWAERNTGNISIDISEFFNPAQPMESSKHFPYSLPEESANLTQFITRTGCYLWPGQPVLNPPDLSCRRGKTWKNLFSLFV
jgi:hypothetical protein